MPIECPHCTKEVKDAIPKSRFDQVYADRKTAKAEAERLAAELEAAAGASEAAAGLQTRIVELETQLAAAGSRFDTFRDLSAAGFSDPSVIAGIKQTYQALPEDGRPELAAWVEACKADPTTAPALLRPHFARVAAPPAAATPPAPPAASEPPPAAQTQVPPRANVAARPYTTAPPRPTPDQIMSMKPEEFRKFGESMGWGSAKPSNGV